MTIARNGQSVTIPTAYERRLGELDIKHELQPVNSAHDAASYRTLGLWKDQTLYSRFRQAALKYPERLAIACGPRAIRYGELLQRIDALAGNFMKLGIEAGQIATAQLPNSPDVPLIYFALNRIGALFMPMHDSLPETELAHLLKKANAVGAIVPLQHRDSITRRRTRDSGRSCRRSGRCTRSGARG